MATTFLPLAQDISVVRYSVLHENEQLFASKYKLVLPSEEGLKTELEKERQPLVAADGVGDLILQTAPQPALGAAGRVINQVQV